MMKRLLIAAVLPVLASGCSVFNPADSDTFACPGMPMGIVCKTPMAVYKSTNQMPAATDSDMPIGQTVKGVKFGDNQGNVARPDQVPVSAALPGLGLPAGVTADSRPIRTPAQVMRIWIGPWIDSKDDLHYPSYLFTEVQPRRWSFGKTEFGGQGVVVPHRDLVAGAKLPISSKKDSASAHPFGKSGVPQLPPGATHQDVAVPTGDSAAPQMPSASDINLD
ncbi:type IV conjugative transfer system protein TraV (plasmid) [Burkholderia sp. KK1]|uniref:Type IV conjugative transfer system lipoprotein TraV n=1 Tax=Burkholderia sp. M701 TaxID=326454 RepID=V5YQR0_9BURK|nr:type IV conjugative transfer system lipoprotein TraV [Burkholderia sp. M701]AQH06021.1 type IV conjugative transfer system protein TraV [Burkholderia sp. KK1]BAO19261.1 type IV conjugative transfer system lipoprotein TraV [Burkholderia sp. M701]